MITDENGNFRTQRQLPKMALIKLSLEGDHLVLNAPGKEPLKIPTAIKNNGERIKCRLEYQTCNIIRR
jgi:uncharacterized protein YcbX